MRILIAEDDATSRLLLEGALKSFGHEVIVARDGGEAWQAAQRAYFPVLISDYRMPQLNGIELCQRVRALQLPDYTYIVLVTASDVEESRIAGMDAGADDFLTKPFSEDYLGARLRSAQRLLDLHSSLRRANDELELRVRERTAALEEALQTKDEFLSRMSHELRTPLNHILGFAQLLEMSDRLAADEKHYVDRILAGGRHLLDQVNKVLSLREDDQRWEDFFPAAGPPG